MIAMTTRLILIRHGESEDNAKNKFQSAGIGLNLTERGKTQAEAVAAMLKETKLDAIYSSPTKRTVQTAEIINKYHKLKINIEEKIIDRIPGILAGKVKDKLSPEERKVVEGIRKDENMKIPGGGESFSDVKARVRKTVSRILKEHKDKTVLIVSHGNTIRAITAQILGLPMTKTYEMSKSMIAGYTEIEIDEKPKLIKFFCTNHLADI